MTPLRPQRIVIAGAAGRDFHDFNTVFRDDDGFQVVAFTATQIPNIEGRLYPPALSGPLYPQGIPIYPEAELEQLIAQHGATGQRPAEGGAPLQIAVGSVEGIDGPIHR